MKIKLYKISFFLLCFFVIDSVFHIGRLFMNNSIDIFRLVIFCFLLFFQEYIFWKIKNGVKINFL